MRRLFTTGEAAASGLTMGALKWGERRGRWRRVRTGVYAEGRGDPSQLDEIMAEVVATGGVARGQLAAVLHGLDGAVLDGRPIRRGRLRVASIVTVDGIRCGDGRQTLVDLAATVDDARWEQALESALRKRLVSIDQLVDHLPEPPGDDPTPAGCPRRTGPPSADEVGLRAWASGSTARRIQQV
jgi:hypothetical protein